MTTIESVLLAIGPNDRSHVDTLLDVVESVAGPTGAMVYLVHVFTHDEYNELMGQMDADSTTEDIGPDELAARQNDVRTPVSRLEELRIDHEIRGVVGYPNKEIVKTANELGVDMLFIGGQHRSPSGKAIFGDSAQQILLNAACPVTYVQRE
jgi:nucleotide-binding universal stress UspA family protein